MGYYNLVKLCLLNRIAPKELIAIGNKYNNKTIQYLLEYNNKTIQYIISQLELIQRQCYSTIIFIQIIYNLVLIITYMINELV